MSYSLASVDFDADAIYRVLRWFSMLGTWDIAMDVKGYATGIGWG